jgi:hypothetical protein
MRVDKEKDSVAFDNMQDRPINGTTGWQKYEWCWTCRKTQPASSF